MIIKKITGSYYVAKPFYLLLCIILAIDANVKTIVPPKVQFRIGFKISTLVLLLMHYISF